MVRPESIKTTRNNRRSRPVFIDYGLPEGMDPQTGGKRKLSDKFIIKFCGNIGGTLCVTPM